MDYGKALKKLRTDARMTQQTLAERVNVTAQAISKWENGVNQPDIAMLERLCAEFSVSVDEFLALARGEEGAPAAGGENTPAQAAETNPALDPAVAAAVVSALAPAGKKKRSRDYPWYYVAGALALAILGFILAAILVFGRGKKLTAQQVYDRVNPSVFCIEVETEYGKQRGSGFFIDNRGTAVTNYHVIKGGLYARIMTSDGEQYDVESILGADEERDLAVVKVDIPRSRGVSFAYRVHTGETVYAIGYPESFLLGTADSTFTNGIVSKASYYVNGNYYIQTNADMTHGNSGGVLLNARGQVIGITTGQLNVSGASYMNLAIPSAAIHTVERDVNMTLEEFFSQENPKTPEYTVTFYNGAKQIATRKVEEGKTVASFTPEVEGYTFGGWFADKQLNTRFDFSAPILTDTKIYGKFTAITYYISYSPNGGSGEMSRRAVKYDTSYQIEACAFTYTRWQFSVWEGTVNGTKKQFTAGQSVKNLTAKDGEEIVLTAVWEKWKYTIVYDAAGGKCSKNSETVAVGDGVSLPEPTYQGYVFQHWQWGDKTYNAFDVVTDLDPTFTLKQITLTAVWKPITFTVRYHSNDTWGGSDDDTVEEVVTFGDAAPHGEKFFSKTGYTFYRWQYPVSSNSYYTINAGAPNKTVFVQGATIDFYSEWNPIEYFVEWDYEGDGVVNRTEKVRYDESFYVHDSYVTLPTGMAVDYWELKTSGGDVTSYSNGDRIFRAESTAGAHCRVTAIWRPLRYEIIYYNPEYDSPNFYETVSWGETYTIRGDDAVSRTGYTVMGWSDSAHTDDIAYEVGAQVKNLVAREGGILWLYGVWRAHTYTVEFSAPDADSGKMEKQTFTYDEAQSLSSNAFVRAGYYLAGWQFGEQIFRDGEWVKNLTAEDEATVTLTAVWAAALEGEGTAENPYLISDFEGLNKMAHYVSYLSGGAAAHYALTADIDAKGATFAPIGNAETGKPDSMDAAVIFSGTLDGRGHIVKNIVFSQASSDDNKSGFSGLFARVEGGAVKNLGIVDYSINILEESSLNYFHYSYTVGPLAGQMTGASVVEQVFASGAMHVVGGSKRVVVGGLVGHFEGTMSASYASGTLFVAAQGGNTGGNVTTNTLCVGGLVGYVSAAANAEFNQCYASANVEAELKGSSRQIDVYLGGFVGLAEGTAEVRFNACFATGDVVYTSSTVPSVGRFLGKGENAVFRTVYVNAESRLKPSSENQTGIREAYTNELTSFAWVKENLSFDEGIWTAKAGALPTLKVFEEGMA